MLSPYRRAVIDVSNAIKRFMIICVGSDPVYSEATINILFTSFLSKFKAETTQQGALSKELLQPIWHIFGITPFSVLFAMVLK